MPTSSPSRTFRLLVPVVTLTLLAGCTGGGQTPAPPQPSPSETTSGSTSGPTSAAPRETSPSTEAAVATLPVAVGGAQATATVRPLVRTGNLVVATIDYTGLSDDGGLPSKLLGGGYLKAPQYSGVRLVDLRANTVRQVATDAAGKPVATYADGRAGQGTSPRIQIAFAAPEAGVTSLGLFLPGAPYVPAVPIIEGDVPPPMPAEARVRPFDLTSVAAAPVFELQSMTSELEDAIVTETSVEKVVINLGSDVLFAVNEATLTGAAKKAIERAAATIRTREPGTVAVVGHTDDNGSTADNQRLSERRAAAVAKALRAALASDDYAIEDSGRGESEPLVPNDSAANRTKNRRVGLTLESTVTTEREVATGELPPLEDGQTASGADGVTFDGARQFRLRAPRARLIDGNIVVDLEVTATDDAVNSSFMLGGLGPRVNARGGDSTLISRTAGAVRLLVGAEQVHPADYLVDGAAPKDEVWLPLAELSIQNRLDGGQSRTFSVVYPDFGGASSLTEVTVQARPLGLDPFRLTAIPVEKG
ncbi:OmpA family protein [Sanguibacter sp. A247]|uniref:OmpA family protein n=1 Tax=unclassified Sanguibacter TaxID=2645534 RepID=UPI003FD8B449